MKIEPPTKLNYVIKTVWFFLSPFARFFFDSEFGWVVEKEMLHSKTDHQIKSARVVVIDK